MSKMGQLGVEGFLEEVDRRALDVSRERWMMVLVISFGVFMATLDSSIVQIALPKITNTFGLDLGSGIEWVSIGYLLMNAIFLLPFGRLADMVGRRKVFLVGISVFTIASCLCAFAPTLVCLIIVRILQGLGAAMMLAVSMALLTSTFPHARGKALGFNALIAGVGTSTGPALGSFILTVMSWHWIFVVNIPVGAVGMWFAYRLVREQSVPQEHEPIRFDYLGMCVLALSLGCLMLYISFGQQVGWTSCYLLVCLAVGILFLGLFPFVEHFVSFPLLDLRLLRNGRFMYSVLSLMLCYGSLIGISFLLPFYCVESRGDSSLLAGAVLVSFPASLALVSPVSGLLVDRIGTRWLPTLGLSVVVVGLIGISFLSVNSSLVTVVGCLVVTGIGQALFLSPNNACLMGSVEEGQRGIASSALASARTIGQSFGIAISGAIFRHFGGSEAGHLLEIVRGDQSVELQAIFSFAFREAFLMCALLAMVGVVSTYLRTRCGIGS